MLIPSNKPPGHKAHLETITIDAWKVRAAMVFQAVGDGRYYLNGVCIQSSGRIVATNGHCAIAIPIDQPPTLDTIISISGKVPQGAQTVELDFQGDGGGFLKCRNSRLSIVKVLAFEIVDGKFPDLDRVIPTDEEREYSKANNPRMPAVQGLYLAKCHQATSPGGNSFSSLVIEPQTKTDGSDVLPVLVRNSYPGRDSAIMIIMPVRE